MNVVNNCLKFVYSLIRERSLYEGIQKTSFFIRQVRKQAISYNIFGNLIN